MGVLNFSFFLAFFYREIIGRRKQNSIENDTTRDLSLVGCRALLALSSNLAQQRTKYNVRFA